MNIPFYVDVFFPLSQTLLLPDLIMTNLTIFFLFLCWSVFMQQIWIYLIFISFSIKKSTDLKEKRSATCQICLPPFIILLFPEKT